MGAPLLDTSECLASLNSLPKVFVASDTRLHRDGLVWGLVGNGRLQIVGSGDSVETAFAQLGTLSPSVLLVDMLMVNALDLLKATNIAYPEIKIVAFAVSVDDQSVCSCIEAGAAAYVPREASIDDLVATVEQVTRGETRCSPRIMPSLFRRLASLAQNRSDGEQRVKMTLRENQIVRLLEQGFSNKEIASQLGIEVATAKNHVHNILEKLQIHRRSQIAARVGPRWLPSQHRSV